MSIVRIPAVGNKSKLVVGALKFSITSAAAATHPPKSSSTGDRSLAQELEALRGLHENGSPTAAEYSQAKARVLQPGNNNTNNSESASAIGREMAEGVAIAQIKSYLTATTFAGLQAP